MTSTVCTNARASGGGSSCRWTSIHRLVLRMAHFIHSGTRLHCPTSTQMPSWKRAWRTAACPSAYATWCTRSRWLTVNSTSSSASAKTSTSTFIRHSSFSSLCSPIRETAKTSSTICHVYKHISDLSASLIKQNVGYVTNHEPKESSQNSVYYSMEPIFRSIEICDSNFNYSGVHMFVRTVTEPNLSRH